MIETHPCRVAFVACGGLREFSRCYHTWNVFPEQHNFVFTWDTDYTTILLNHVQYPTQTKTDELIKAKREGYIKDYEVFVETSQFSAEDGIATPGSFKNLFLWSILDTYISYDYDYIFISRPDMVLFKQYTEGYKLPQENEIQVSWVDEERLSASDGDFFMTRSTYKKFSEIYQYSVTNRLIKPDMYTHVGVHVHLLIYQFCKDMGINLVLTEGRGLVEGVIRRPDLRIKKDISVAEGHQSIQKNFILQNKYNLNEIVRKAILFVSTDFSNEERIRELKMQYSNTNEYMCFESSSESIGLQKIKGFERNYNTKFSDITTFIL